VERKRAYRERLAADHAEPERLRRELRIERKRVAERDQELTHLDRKLARAKAEVRDLLAQISTLLDTVEAGEAQLEFWQDRARKLEDRLAEQRERGPEAGVKARCAATKDRPITDRPTPSAARHPRSCAAPPTT
jgi:chromosome segregation ATPase